MTRLTPQEIDNEIDLAIETPVKKECDHSFEFIKDTQGDGSDCSFYRCLYCPLEFFPEDAPEYLGED